MAEAESLPPGVTPVYADAAALMLDVETPNGEALAIDSPALIDMLRVGIDEKHQPTLLRYDRAMTDAVLCRSLLCNRQENLAKKLA